MDKLPVRPARGIPFLACPAVDEPTVGGHGGSTDNGFLKTGQVEFWALFRLKKEKHSWNPGLKQEM